VIGRSEAVEMALLQLFPPDLFGSGGARDTLRTYSMSNMDVLRMQFAYACVPLVEFDNHNSQFPKDVFRGDLLEPQHVTGGTSRNILLKFPQQLEIFHDGPPSADGCCFPPLKRTKDNPQ